MRLKQKSLVFYKTIKNKKTVFYTWGFFNKLSNVYMFFDKKR